MVDGIKVFFVEKSGLFDLETIYKCNICDGLIRVLGERSSSNNLDETSFKNRLIETAHCDKCNVDAIWWGACKKPVYRRDDMGELITNLSEHPGACYADDTYWDRTSRADRTGPDGRVLYVVLPDGFHWCIDSRSSNCTRKDDNIHRCWHRTGSCEVGSTQPLHVDKGGNTCSAGSGSIFTDSCHLFLHQGFLKSC